VKGVENNYNLESVILDNCSRMESLNIGQKAKLKVLQIERCSNFKRLILFVCPSLEIFSLFGIPYIQGDISVINTCTKLKSLSIIECRLLEVKIQLSSHKTDTIIMFSPGVTLLR
jgi:hypothetical protein